MDLQDQMKLIAKQLLTQFGQSVVHVHNDMGDYIPADGTVPFVANTVYSGVGYPSQYKQYQIDGTVVQQGDILLIFQTDSAVPNINDIFIIDGVEFKALDVQKITLSATDIIYKIQLRQ